MSNKKARGVQTGRTAGSRGAARRRVGLGTRRERMLLALLSLGIVGALVAMGSALALQEAGKNWARVANVNGTDVDRGHLRARVAVLEFLLSERSQEIDTARMASRLSADDATRLTNSIAAPYADIVAAARESLIDDELVRQLAKREGVTAGTVDPWSIAGNWAAGDVSREVRWVRFAMPAKPASPTPAAGPSQLAIPTADPSNIAAARDAIGRALDAATTATAIVDALRAAGWEAAGYDDWLSREGVPAAAHGDVVDPEIAAAALSAQAGAALGPATDELGRVYVGRLVEVHTPDLVGRIQGAAGQAKVDDGAFREWAEAQALRAALHAKLLERWRGGVEQARFHEAVIGPIVTSGTAGPWVAVSPLALDRLAKVDPASIADLPAGVALTADGLVSKLRSMSATDRGRLFDALATAANADSADGVDRSGGVSWVAKGAMLPDLAKLAFTDGVREGDVLGPVATVAGQELFLVRGRFAGQLDDRAQSALAELDEAGDAADLLALTTKWSPSSVPLARDGQWRARPEFGADEPVAKALFESPIGALTDPYELDGLLAVGRVDERRTAAPDARMLARLELDGFDAWFASERSKAKITRDEHPLPELEPSASPSAGSSFSLPPLAPTATPALPAVPGATPVPTDELGLPVLP